MSCLPLPRYQPPGQLEVRKEEFTVCLVFFICSAFNSRVFRFLYYQSFGIDACFRFKRRQISSYEKDPELGPGFAYVVAWEPYNQYLLKHANQREVNNSLLSLIRVSQRSTD